MDSDATFPKVDSGYWRWSAFVEMFGDLEAEFLL